MSLNHLNADDTGIFGRISAVGPWWRGLSVL